MGNDATKVVSETSKNFGIIIAFLLPGFIALWPMQQVSSAVAVWFSGAGLSAGSPGTGGPPPAAPTAGSFLMVVLAALALGMLISAIRWALLDKLLHIGFRRPNLDYSKLQANLGAFDFINENHYRYYQYYANSAIALIVWAFGWFHHTYPPGSQIAVVGAVEVILLLAARDALKKHVDKLTKLLGELPSPPPPPAGGTVPPPPPASVKVPPPPPPTVG